MAVLKLEQDTEWHWRMVLLSCLDFLSTAELSHRRGSRRQQCLCRILMDLGAVELLKKCLFGSMQWFESEQLLQVRLLWFYKGQG